MGQQFLAHWKIWLAVGLIAAAAAEVIGRLEGHPRIGLDIYIAVAVVALVFYVAGFVQRRRRERAILGRAGRR